MVKIREAIVVEGRYDKNTLSQVVDAPFWKRRGSAFLRTNSRWRCCAG